MSYRVRVLRGGESLYRVGMRDFWQTDAVASDYRGRTAVLPVLHPQRTAVQSVRNLPNKIDENWHLPVPTYWFRRGTFMPNVFAGGIVVDQRVRTFGGCRSMSANDPERTRTR